MRTWLRLALSMLLVAAVAAAGSSMLASARAEAGAAPRIALVVGNARYESDSEPLSHPVKDARAFAQELKLDGFEVMLAEDLNKPKMKTELDRFYAKIAQGSTALVFFSGYGMQFNRESYLVPVDALIYVSGEIKRYGTSLNAIVREMHARGAAVELVVVEGARRNPWMRNLPGYRIGLAALEPQPGTLAIYSTAPDKTENDSEGPNSLFVGELLKEMRVPGQSARQVFEHTQAGVSRASNNEQVPSVFSTLAEDFYFGKAPTVSELKPENPPPSTTKVDRLQPESHPAPPRKEQPELASQAADEPEQSEPEPPPPPRKKPAPDNRLMKKLDDTLRRNPRDSDAYYKRGQVLARAGEYAAAAHDFGQAIKLDPQDPEAFNNRCFSRAVLGQLKFALGDCNEALRLRPDYADAFDSRGLVYLKMGRYDEAIADYDSALKLDQNLASSLYGRGQAELKKGNKRAGNSDLAAARELKRDIARDFADYGVQ